MKALRFIHPFITAEAPMHAIMHHIEADGSSQSSQHKAFGNCKPRRQAYKKSDEYR